MIAAIWALTAVVGFGCTSGASQDYPAPPNIGTERQQRELANLARDALTESYPSRRVEKLVKLRDLVGQIARADTSGTARDEVGRFLAETSYVAISNGDHYRGRGGIGGMPPEVTAMPERVPEELVALRITEPRHWVEALYPRMTGSGGLPSDMAKAAGAFETYGSPYPRFLHVNPTLDLKARQVIVETSDYDGLIRALLTEQRLATALRLLSIEFGIIEDDRDFDNYMDLRRQLLKSAAQYFDAFELHQRSTLGAGDSSPAFDYEDAMKQNLMELAHRPEWSVHLYVLSYLTKGTDWYDQEIIDRIAAHANPVSMRFLAAKGMIDPALVPEPAYETLSGARVIPSSRATSRPAATGPD